MGLDCGRVKLSDRPLGVIFYLSAWLSISFQPSIANYLCFHRHSGFVPNFSTAVLCFDRHSRVVPSNTKNSSSRRQTSWPVEKLGFIEHLGPTILAH